MSKSRGFRSNDGRRCQSDKQTLACSEILPRCERLLLCRYLVLRAHSPPGLHPHTTDSPPTPSPHTPPLKFHQGGLIDIKACADKMYCHANEALRFVAPPTGLTFRSRVLGYLISFNVTVFFFLLRF